MIYLKQSTAATIKLGPFVDSTDGVTAEDGLTIQKADVRLSKNGGNMAAAAADQGESDAGAAHDEIGYYDISLGTGDTDTLGRLKVMVSESGALPVWAEYEVVPANVFDSIVAGTDKLDTNAAELGGTSQSGRDVGASVLLDSAYDAAKIGAGPVFAVNPPIEHSSTSNILRLYVAAKSGSGGYNSLAYNTANLSIAVRPSNDEGTPPKFMYDSGDSEIEAISAIGTYQAPSAGCCRFGFASPSGCYELHLADAVFAEAGATGLTVYVSGGADWQESLLEVPLVGYDPQNVAEAGDEMALTSAYDAAKTAAQAGDEMDLVDAPNGTAVTAIQSGLSTHSAADAATAVWAAGTRTLTSFGTLAADAATAVWAAGTRTLTAISDSSGVTTLLSRILGTLDTGTHKPQSGDAYGVVANVTYGNSAIKTETALIYADTDELQKNQGNWATATGFATPTNVTDATSPLATSSQAESISQAIDALNDLSTSDVQAIIDVIAGAEFSTETLVAIKAAIDALEAGAAPTVEEMEAYFAGKHGSGAWGGATGSGDTEHQWPEDGSPIEDADGNPLEGVAVWITSDDDGDTLYAGTQYSQSDGYVAEPWLMTSGVTYYGWLRKGGYTFENPYTIEVP